MTKEKISEELKKETGIFSELYKYDSVINMIEKFYQTYPQYAELQPTGAHVVNVSLRYHSVGVWKFSNGDILFIGGVGSSKDPAPLAGIGGGGLPIPPGFQWTKPETFLTLIEILPKWNS